MKILTIILVLICGILDLTIAQPFKQFVWPNGIPGNKENNEYKERSITLDNGGVRVYNVKQPQIEVYLPSKEKAHGTAVLILPGGGYGRLAIDKEGVDVAKWLNENGIAGIVLKYRLPNDSIMENKAIGPLMDAQESIRIIRRNAKQWGINPGKVGVIGFSAGGHLAGSVSTLYSYKTYQPSDSTSCRPDFSLLIYGVLSMDPSITHKQSRINLISANPSAEIQKLFSAEMNVTKDTPPSFLVHAADDKSVNPENSIRYVHALNQLKIPVELHLYQSGGHGFGLGKNGGTESTWPNACLVWLKVRGLL